MDDPVKFSSSDVLRIRAAHAGGVKTGELARRFRCSRGAIYKIVTFRSHKNVKDHGVSLPPLPEESDRRRKNIDTLIRAI